METLECINTRRSTRNFDGTKKVSNDIIQSIILAGMQAPSARNRQPWAFLVLTRHCKLLQIMTDKYNEIKEYKDPGSLYQTIKCMENASTIILVFNNQFSTYFHDREFRRHRWLADVQSIGACIQNMLLACENLNLGALWICDVFYADQEIKDAYQRTDELVAAIAIGHKASNTRKKKYLNELDQIVQWEHHH